MAQPHLLSAAALTTQMALTTYARVLQLPAVTVPVMAANMAALVPTGVACPIMKRPGAKALMCCVVRQGGD
jgi:hypothetical protein